MKSLKNKFFLLVFILLSICVHAQVNLDSLWAGWVDDGQEIQLSIFVVTGKALYDYTLKIYKLEDFMDLTLRFKE